MYIFKAHNLAKDWNGQQLFSNLDLELKEGEHIAIFGRNGSGKTTLLKGLFNKHSFDKGDVQRFVPIEQWGWLDQALMIEGNFRAIEMVESADSIRFKLKKELEGLESELTGDSNSHPDLWEKYNHCYEKFLEADGYNLSNEAERQLQKVNLPEEVWEVPFNQLSGGQKTKVQIARLLMQNPKCILMDEPTNHLDQATLIWLEEWMRNFKGAILFVSHDRLFLDRVAHGIYELNKDSMKKYKGGYSAYKEQKAIEWKTQETLYKKQERERKALEEAIDRYQKWFNVAHKAAGNDHFLKAKAKKNVSRFKAKESALQHLENNKVEKPREKKNINIRLEAANFSARTLIRVEKLSFAYGDHTVISDANFTVNRGDRMVILGPNGTGKTTILKLLIGELTPTDGRILPHPQLKIGYFSQELHNLDNEETLIDSLLIIPNMTQSEARTILGSFLFPRDDVFKKVKHLSMGEKCRIAFLKLYFSEANLLILDEPTNFLDVSTREVIEYALQSYPGAQIIVTHDRYLVDKVADRILLLQNEGMIDFHGNYKEFEAFFQKGKLSNEEQLNDNQLQQLQLKLTQLITTETDDATEEEQVELLKEIIKVKQKIKQLKA